MRWKTVIWFTVTLAGACAAHRTIDTAHLFVTNAINEDRDLSNQLPSSISIADRTTASSTTGHTVTTVTSETSETTKTPTPTEDTTRATTISTPNNVEQITEGITIPEENDDGVSVAVPNPPPSGPTTPGQQDDGDNGDQEYIVLTTRGLVQGYPWHTNPNIIAYIDIPYASFQTYFQDPTPPSAWENIHQVREHNKRCPHLQGDTYVGDLDCLTLSVFTPVEALNASVLFHIHESNFVQGSGDPAIYGPEYFVSKGVILVLPNYRLGPLGFLCLNNATAPGNAALKDLTLALKWISENIRAFGGDPSNVVVSGDGTSGALVGYLALAPGSSGYFHKAITESGAVLSHWALDRNPVATANALVQRIREISTPNNSIEAAGLRIIVLAAREIVFSPCIESNGNPFLLDTPWSMLQNTITNITVMIGSASHAGAIETVKINESIIAQINNKFESFLPSDLHFVDDDARANVGNRVRRQYFGNDNITLDHVEEMALCHTDSCYLGPALRVARALLQAGARVFFYEFGFVGKLNRELDSINRPFNGTVRGDIVGYLFSQDGVTPAEGTVERTMVDLMTDLWISFIDNGTPASKNITWTELNSTSVTEESWLFIGEEVEMRSGPHKDRMELWTDIYTEYFIEHNAAFQDLPNILALLFPIIYIGLWKTSL